MRESFPAGGESQHLLPCLLARLRGISRSSHVWRYSFFYLGRRSFCGAFQPALEPQSQSPHVPPGSAPASPPLVAALCSLRGAAARGGHTGARRGWRQPAGTGLLPRPFASPIPSPPLPVLCPRPCPTGLSDERARLPGPGRAAGRLGGTSDSEPPHPLTKQPLPRDPAWNPARSVPLPGSRRRAGVGDRLQAAPAHTHHPPHRSAPQPCPPVSL